MAGLAEMAGWHSLQAVEAEAVGGMIAAAEAEAVVVAELSGL